MAVTLGLDFGTNSVRALLVRCESGQEIGTSVVDYPHGHQGVILDPRNANLRYNDLYYSLAKGLGNA
jgi:L-ribulokinase